VDALRRDLRQAARLIVKHPGFTAVAVISLALGIGANTAIFSLVNALLLRPMPVARPDEIVSVFTSDFSGPLYGASSYPDYLDFRRLGALSDLAAWAPTPVALAQGADSQRMFAEAVSANYFDVLGVRPVLGRGFVPEEGEGPHAVAVIAHGTWQRVFGGDPAVVGRSLTLNGTPFRVVGVAPPGYSAAMRGLAMDVWIPLSMQEVARTGRDGLTSRGNRGIMLTGRLKPGTDIAAAQARFDALARELHRAYPRNWTDVQQRVRRITLVSEAGGRVFPLVRGPVLGFMALLMTVVGLVLLIACANLANLLLARASARRREIGIRLALGAGRWALLRQLLAESVLLSLLGGVAGAMGAAWTAEALSTFRPPLPVPVVLDLGLDLRVLAFTLAVSLATGVLFGLAPALAATRTDVVSALKDDGAGTGAGPRRSRLRSALVVGQVSVALLLLVGSGLFLRSLRNAHTIDPGFEPGGLAMASVDLVLGGQKEDAGRAFYLRALAEARALPGVVAATFVKDAPLGLGGTRRGMRIEGYTPRPHEDMEVALTAVGPGYFETMRIPVHKGRPLLESDGPGRPLVAVVNEAFVRRYWNGQEALGRRLRLGGEQAPYTEVVGVARDGKYRTLGEDPRPFVFLPLLQDYDGEATLIARTGGSPAEVASQLRRRLFEIDPRVPVFDVKTMDEHLRFTLLPIRLAASVLGLFGAVALLLATLGLYGVMSYVVSQRHREVGIRMALGARPADVLRLVVGQGMRLTLVGMAAGLAAALALTRLVSGLLYGVSPIDPWTFAGVSAVMGSVALVACLLPARRAARVDPLVALRFE
jgi:macrolide transport system ATP-binding/permease protein